ncbi:MAG: hypothetical protein L3J10_00720 [Sulfurimonas sp.]|nr:hypothetical protein [Sulfurimonas sp.]
MYKILKLFISLALILLYVGCGAKPSVETNINKKTFEKEDMYILIALRLEQLKDYKSSADIFNTLYEQTKKKEYLYRSLRNNLSADNNKKVILKVNQIAKNNINDFELIRIKIVALVKLEKLKEAKVLALKLVQKTKLIDDYLLVSELYVKLKEFNTAVKYLESAYIKDYNEKILDRMAIVLYVNLQRQKEAIAQLETHSRIYGCSRIICSRLIGFYSNDNNIEGLLSTYLRIYKINSNKVIAQKIVQLYSYKKDYKNMIKFLQKSRIDDELLLQLYIQFKEYKRASPLAYEMYKDSGDISHLGQSAIFEYESTKDKNNKIMQKSVVKKLTKVVDKKKDGIYLNYLGYLLIDHDIDVRKGLGYVKEALKIESDSIYYLDSLAWGYYKLGECKKAQDIMDRVKNMEGSSNKEVVKHIKMIDKCNKESREIE